MIVPGKALLELWSTSFIVAELLPVVVPVVVPASAPDHTKLLGVLAPRLKLRRVSLQTLVVGVIVNVGPGLTLTVTMDEIPRQVPVVDVGVTEYKTTPTVESLGLDKD